MGERQNDRPGLFLAWWVKNVSYAALWVILLFIAGAGATLYYTISNFRINTDTTEMLSDALPFRQSYDMYKEKFPQQVNTLIVVVDASTPEASRAAAIAIKSALIEDKQLFQSVYFPGDDFFDKQGLMYLNIDKLQELVDNLSTVQPYLAKVTEDPSLRGLLQMLVSGLDAIEQGIYVNLEPVLRRFNDAVQATLADQYYRVSWQSMMFKTEGDMSGRRQFVIAQPILDYSRLFPAEPAINKIREIAESYDRQAMGDVNVRLTGSVALAYEELKSATDGMGVVGVVALFLVIVILIIGLRSIVMVISTLLTLLVGLILTAGFAIAAVGELNLISIAFAVLYIGLAVDFAIHFCMRYDEEAQRKKGTSPALVRAAQAVGPSVTLCAVTTAVGFYAFIPTAYAGVSELGIIAGTGMFIGLALSLTLLPAFLSVAQTPRRHAAHRRRIPPVGKWLSEFPFQYARSIRWSAAILGVVGLVLLPEISFDYNPINLRNPESESVSTYLDLVKASETPPWSITILTDSQKRLEEYARQLSKLRSVDEVVSLRDFIPKNQQEKMSIIEDLKLILGGTIAISTDVKKPSFEAQHAALQDFDRKLEEFINTDNINDWGDLPLNLHSNIAKLLHSIDTNPKPAGIKMITMLEQSLLATLPENIHRLNALLQATYITMKQLPRDLIGRWRNDDTYRLEVFPKEDLRDNKALKKFVADVSHIAPEATGAPVLNVESGKAVITAFMKAFAISVIAITLLLYFMLRDVKDTLLVLVPLFLGGILTGAFTVVLDIPFNFANVIALPLLLGIGVDNGIHMMYRMRQGMASNRVLLRTCTARAIYFSALTTMLSFGSLILSPHPGMASMGKVLIMGTLLTLLSTIAVLPALFDIRFKKQG